MLLSNLKKRIDDFETKRSQSAHSALMFKVLTLLLCENSLSRD
jgi:hypothetical protein